MNLNNKGFAFSTMLYGVLSLIIVVIMLVFSLLQYVKNETYYYSTEIEDQLNKCVLEEIALENCYTSTSGSGCDPTSYYACLGISGITDGSTGGFIIAETLKENVVATGDGLYQDSINPKRYLYRGNSVNNYVKCSGLVWRIVSIESDGSVKVVYPGFADSLVWDNTNNGEWSGSSLNNYLNGVFYSSLSDTSRLIKGKVWHVGWVYSEVDKTVSKLISEEEMSDYSILNNSGGVIGLLSTSDFVSASLSEVCHNDVLGSSSCSSWLSGYKSWLINPYGDSIVAPDGESETIYQQAYYFDNENKLKTELVNVNQSVLPTAFLDRTLVITSGTGTESNPYIVG